MVFLGAHFCLLFHIYFVLYLHFYLVQADLVALAVVLAVVWRGKLTMA
jgi:hypothetical protein